MLLAEIRIDERLEPASSWRHLGCPNQPLRKLLETNRERLREEIFLAIEVPVEPAMGQPEVPHQVRNRRTLTAAAPKAAGGGPDYFAEAERELMLVVMIETAEGIARIDEIMAVDGVDGCLHG